MSKILEINSHFHWFCLILEWFMIYNYQFQITNSHIHKLQQMKVHWIVERNLMVSAQVYISIEVLLYFAWKGCKYWVFFNVLFIPFFIFGFWSLLATKLQKYKNITLSLYTFCKARWARRKKGKENHVTKMTKIPMKKT